MAVAVAMVRVRVRVLAQVVLVRARRHVVAMHSSGNRQGVWTSSTWQVDTLVPVPVPVVVVGQQWMPRVATRAQQL